MAFNSGTLESDYQNSDMLAQLYDVIETELKAVQSNGGDAWEEYDVINATSPNEDKIFRSLGDRTLVSGAGDAGLFVRLHQFDFNTLEIILYQDWSTNGAGSGARPSSTSQLRIDVANTYSEIKWWRASNEYEFFFFWLQANSWKCFWFGNPKRTHVPPAANGIARLALDTAAGTDIVFELDRDITANIVPLGDLATETLTLIGNLQDGDQVLIDAKTYTFQATLTNVDGNVHIGATASDTIDNLINAIKLGPGAGTDYATAMTLHPTVRGEAGAGDTMDAYAKVGGTAGNSIATTDPTDGGGNMSWGAATMSGGTDNPAAQKVWVYNQTVTGDVLEASGVEILTVRGIRPGWMTLSPSSAYADGALIGQDPSAMGGFVGTNSADGSVYFPNGLDGTYTIAQNIADFEAALLNAFGSSNRPGPNNLYMGCEVAVSADQGSKQGPRGTVEAFGFFAVGTQASRDRMFPDFDSAQAYKLFTGLLNNSYALGIGPNAPA
jgi:hypothetical protein